MLKNKQVKFGGQYIDKDIFDEAEEICSTREYISEEEYVEDMIKEIELLQEHEEYLVAKGKMYSVQIAMFVLGFITAVLLVW